MSVGQLTCALSYASQYTKPFNEISSVVTELQNALACAERVLRAHRLGTGDSRRRDGRDLPDRRQRRPRRRAIRVFARPSTHQGLHAFRSPRTEDRDRRADRLRQNDNDKPAHALLRRRLRQDSRRRQRTSAKSGGPASGRRTAWYFRIPGSRRGTIRDNIRFGKPDATDAEIVAAAKSSHAHGFIKRLPAGYDTVVSGDGSALSQGEMQLLCITRVMLSLPPMLILDEATSSIDVRTEVQIQKAFAEMMKGPHELYRPRTGCRRSARRTSFSSCARAISSSMERTTSFSRKKAFTPNSTKVSSRPDGL